MLTFTKVIEQATVFIIITIIITKIYKVPLSGAIQTMSVEYTKATVTC